MAEVSITKWLDPALEYFAKEAGLPVAQYSSQVGGEGIGVGLEVIADFFTKGWLNKAIQSATGLIADGYAIWGKDVPTRLRRELLALGTHELFRFVDPKPSDVIEFQRSLTTFIDAMKRGDYNAALASVLRTPSEITTMAKALGIPVATSPPGASPPGASTSPPATEKKYTVKPKTAPSPPPAPAPTPPPTPAAKPAPGRYSVTG